MLDASRTVSIYVDVVLNGVENDRAISAKREVSVVVCHESILAKRPRREFQGSEEVSLR